MSKWKLIAACLVVIGGSGFSATEESQIRLFSGMCDASAAVWITDQIFAVANDEDNVLRLYSLSQDSAPLRSINLSSFLRIIPKHPEADLEGAAREGDWIYWIGSHGRNKEGKFRPNRHRFFLTRIEWDEPIPTLQPVGVPRTDLLQWIQRIPALRSFRLENGRAPKQGGVNIEGLAADGEGGVWIGFRSPLREGRALMVHLLNARAYLMSQQTAPRFGAIDWLDLGGLGIRSLVRIGKGRYLILAGPVGGEGRFAVYLWDRNGERPIRGTWRIPERLEIHPESLLWVGRKQEGGKNRHIFWVVSDDGTRRINDRICKELSDPRQRGFRLIRMEAEFPLCVR